MTTRILLSYSLTTSYSSDKIEEWLESAGLVRMTTYTAVVGNQDTWILYCLATGAYNLATRDPDCQHVILTSLGQHQLISMCYS